MKNSPFGRRIVHGVLLVSFMSTASTLVNRGMTGLAHILISIGYDKIRFIAPVFFGDTVTIVYRINSVDTEHLRTEAAVEAHNQHAKLVAVAKHILKWVPARQDA